MPTVNQIDNSTWSFEEGGVRFFLLTGSEKALLIDSGMQAHNAREFAAQLTDLPIFLLNTHADPDHIASNHEFESFYMHPSEYVVYYNIQHRSGNALPVWEGDILELGGRPLRVIAMPGHTQGSIAVLDINNRRLFSGDPIQDGSIFMFGLHRNMRAYVQSLERLQKHADEFDEIFPSHGSCPVNPELISQLIHAANDIIGGKIQGVRREMFGTPVIAYDVGAATFLCDA